MQQNLSEFSIIEDFFKPLTANGNISQNLADDVAKIEVKDNQQLIVSKDMMVQDVHFSMNDGPSNIAQKLLLSNLSDIASSGATPLYYMLGFSKNKYTDRQFITDFTSGLKHVQDAFNISLIGGDTVKSDKLVFSITIFGVINKNQNLARQQAKHNDLIFVSGTIGDAYIGLHHQHYALSAADHTYFRNRHLLPQPRIALAQALVKHKLSKCAADISDGLLADLHHICQASNISAKIEQDKIPFSKQAQKLIKKHPDLLLKLISAGDDYELIFTANAQDYDQIMQLSRTLDINLTCIGKCNKKNNETNLTLLDNNANIINIDTYGYEH